MIDTKELRRIAHAEFVETNCLTGQYSPTCDLLQCADELDRLYHDTTPLSREELETVLKEAGFDGDSRWTSYVKKGFSLTIHSNDTVSIWGMFNIYGAPFSAVTRRLLRDCGVIE